MLICSVIGARPNFMKIAPIVHELRNREIPNILVHTGQHYDYSMSQVFFEELDLPHPDVYLGVGSDTHARQTARIMIAFEEVCQRYQPDLIIVVGDVNSSLAAAITASKLSIPIAHVEAGLRSFDRTMPEEINRIIIDHLSELLFTTEPSANENLLREGIDESRIHYVGNCMVDTLLKYMEIARRRAPWRLFGFEPGGYALLTLHRPSNVDDPKTLRQLMEVINDVSTYLPILFPTHPRTKQHLEKWKIPIAPTVHISPPLSYLTFLGLMAEARYVLTDSGGIQEETTVLKVPCLTLRWNTERPITCTIGTNRLVGQDPEKIHQSVKAILSGEWPSGQIPPLWDGKASQRIVEVIQSWGAKKLLL